MQTYAADPIRVLVVDDDRRFAEVVTIVLATEPEIEVIGRAHNGSEAVALAQALEPDVVLMDVNMPVMDGIEATRRICAELPCVHVLVLTGSASALDIDRARLAGAAGYLTKDRIATELAVTVLNAVPVYH